MILVLKKQITDIQRDNILQEIRLLGGTSQATSMGGREFLYVEDVESEQIDFSNMEGVARVLADKQENPLSSFKKERTQISLGEITIGDGSLTLIAGPCAIESEEQAFEIAQSVKQSGAQILRGGAFKPRTSPYSFQGLGKEGLQILSRIKKSLQMPIITELMDPRDLADVCEVADIIQIGTRNMQNFSLLKEVGKTNKPVLLKRGMSATIKEWLLSAEYILEKGNSKVILCERGIRSFDSETRNLLDLSSVALAKQLSHLPVIVDPSHALGRRDILLPMSLAALAAGADGLMIEVHDVPHRALSDGAQAMGYQGFSELVAQAQALKSSLSTLSL